MVTKVNQLHKITRWVLSAMAIPIALLLLFQPASSLEMTNRSVRISSAVPSATVSNIFTFIIPSTNVLGSLAFEYCTNSPVTGTPCTAPAGLDVGSASLSAQSLNTGFSKDNTNTTANRLVLSRAAAPATIGSSSYTINGVINPSSTNQTVFIRITAYSSTDGSGTYTDDGSVAFSTAQANFSVGLFVPPYLTFCTGVTVSIDCTSATGSLVTFGELSDSKASAVTTQMSAATNDFSGYNIFIGGQTLTSGNNVIDALETAATSQTGVSQFGINLRSNSSPSIGAETQGIGTGAPSSGYNTQNQFKFTSGDRIASSPVSSEFTRFTASYIVNINPDQPAGVYAATFTYMAVVSF